MADWIKRFSLEGRKAMVTGASKGIGAEICARLRRCRGRYRRRRPRRGRAGRDRRRRARAGPPLPDDLRRTGRRRRPAPPPRERALAEWGTIDILVNSAGISRTGPAETFSLKDWDETMAVNLRAPFLLSQALAPAMIAQRWGKIVNISSQTGVIALDDHAAYASSKGGLNALTKSLCAEWARHNVQVNAICPTVVLTPMGMQVWVAARKERPDDRGHPAAPLRRGGRDCRRRALPRLARRGTGQRRDPDDRGRVFECLTLLLDAEAAFARYEAVRPRLPAADLPRHLASGSQTLADVADRYDAFVLDAFGVLNVGDTADPGRGRAHGRPAGAWANG